MVHLIALKGGKWVQFDGLDKRQKRRSMRIYRKRLGPKWCILNDKHEIRVESVYEGIDYGV